MDAATNLFAVCAAGMTYDAGGDIEPQAPVQGTAPVVTAVEEEPKPAHPAHPAHPAQFLQDAYLKSFDLFKIAEEALAQANSMSLTIGYSTRSSIGIDFDDMTTTAVNHTVNHFKAQRMDEGATLDPGNEFERAFGKRLSELISEEREARSARERKLWHVNRARRIQGLPDLMPDPADEQPLKYLQVDLLKLWDSMQMNYADGGIGLARRQAAQAIMSSWRLHELKFEVKNGKAVFDDRIWSEQRYSGGRELNYKASEEMVRLFKAMQVWFDWADYNVPVMQTLFAMCGKNGSMHAIPLTMGASYEVAKGLVQVRTFKEHWRWTLAAAAAESLREFVGTYGGTPGSSA